MAVCHPLEHPWEQPELSPRRRRRSVYVFIVFCYHMPSLPDDQWTKLEVQGINASMTMCLGLVSIHPLHSQFVSSLTQIEVLTQLHENLF